MGKKIEVVITGELRATYKKTVKMTKSELKRLKENKGQMFIDMVCDNFDVDFKSKDNQDVYWQDAEIKVLKDSNDD